MSLASRLRARIALERPETTPDDIGGASRAWTSEGEAWAEIIAGGAGEAAGLDGPSARTTYRVSIRMRRDVLPGWRLRWGARTLRVRTIADGDAQGALLMLECEEEFL